MTFQTLDDKRDCKGVFYNGQFFFDKLPRNLDRTWSWSEHLEGHNVEFGENQRIIPFLWRHWRQFMQ